jgi:hypothetical protein
MNHIACKRTRKPLTDEDINELVVQATLLLLGAAHKVPPDLYKIVEERNLGTTILIRAEKTGDRQLLDDAIAQWG